MNTTNRRSFLKKSFFLPCLTFLATGFKPRGQAKENDILYARRLDGDHGPDRTHIFYLNSRGRNLVDRYTVYEPPVRSAFYHLRDKVSVKWNPLSKDSEEGLLSKGIELCRIPKKYLTETYGSTVAYARFPDALHNLQIILTRLEIPTTVVEI
jgi:hypothetical protein